MMQSYELPVAAQVALRAYLRDRPRRPALPREFLDALIAASDERSAVVGAVKMIDAVMDNYDAADTGLRELAAATATMMSLHGFHGFDVDDKGTTIAKQLRGELPMPVKEEPPEEAAEPVAVSGSAPEPQPAPPPPAAPAP